MHTLELQHLPHSLVDTDNPVAVIRLLFFLKKGETNGDKEVSPSPELEIAPEGK